jgi:trimethylamine--corrinoid protein Co-methyltransferase
MFQVSLLKDTDIEPLAEGVLVVLEEVGILCQNAEMRQALAEMGARVDHEAERVLLPRRLVSEFVEGLRKETERSRPQPPRFVPPGPPGLGTQVAQLYHDYETDERRQGNRRDFVTLAQFGDVLHGDAGVGHALLLTDVPPLVEPLEAAMLLAQYARRPQGTFAWNVRQVPYLVEMGEILGLCDWYTLGAICISHPLRFDRDLADRFVLMAKSGEVSVETGPGLSVFVRKPAASASMGLTAMPVAGATTPVTPEGFIVVSTAEHIAAWMAARALNPAVGLGGSMWAGSIDIKTGQVSYCAFDAMYCAFASVEFVRRWTGVPVGVGGGEYASAKAPGLYTALEKAYKAMMIAAFTGHDPGVGSGMFDDGKVISPVQLLLDRDMAMGVARLGRAVDPSEENIGLEAIREIGLGLQSSHLQTEHLLRHYRQALWMPELIDRAGWAGAEHEKRILDKAHARFRACLAEYRKPEGRDDQLAAMRQVVDRARRELL